MLAPELELQMLYTKAIEEAFEAECERRQSEDRQWTFLNFTSNANAYTVAYAAARYPNLVQVSRNVRMGLTSEGSYLWPSEMEVLQWINEANQKTIGVKFVLKLGQPRSLDVVCTSFLAADYMIPSSALIAPVLFRSMQQIDDAIRHLKQKISR